MENVSMQYLDVVDRMNEMLRNLQIDYIELLLYDHIIKGNLDCVPQSLRPASVFFRACENLSTHLLEMERVCADMQVLHQEMMRK